jgi:transcriptional antiterminator NusG
MARQWYVLSAFSSQENRALEFLRKRIESGEWEGRVFDAMMPEEPVQEIRNGRKRTYKRKMFPGYLLVEMEFTDENYRLVREVPGVSSFVNYDGQTAPRPLSRSELKNLLAKTPEERKEEPQTPQMLFRLDERVKITDGAFKDFIGVVEEINPEKGRLKVRVEIFGRSTPVDVDALQVERVS